MNFCSAKYLSFDVFDSMEYMDPIRMKVIKTYSAKFARSDRLVLYPIIVILATDLLLILYQMTNFTADNVDSQLQSVFMGQILFVISFAFLITAIRATIFKFLLLHPAVNLLRNIPTLTGIVELSFCLLSLVGGIGLNMLVAILAVQNLQRSALLATVFDVLAYIACLIFYRLHIGAYIKLLAEQEIAANNPGRLNLQGV